MTERLRGVLVVIEGIDGVGKSTLQRELARRWRRRGLRVHLTTEPSKGVSGQLARREAAGDPWVAAQAFTEDRRRSRPAVEAALRAGRVVVQDRSFYSTLAYQGSSLTFARRRALTVLQRKVARTPDRVLWLDLPVATAVGRMARRGRSREATEAVAVLRRARTAYRRLARGSRWVRLDARQSPAEVADAADRALAPWLARRLRPTRSGA